MDKAEILAFIRGRLQEQAELCLREMDLAQESANSEEKSSAGDKYETGRAMSQQQRDFFARRAGRSGLMLFPEFRGCGCRLCIFFRLACRLRLSNFLFFLSGKQFTQFVKTLRVQQGSSLGSVVVVQAR